MKNFCCKEHTFLLGEKTYIMGILNVTPDSFYDGGKFFTIENAIAYAKQMEEDGADIIDVGGQSTRPGYNEISIAEELERIIPIIERLSKELSIPLSIDTYRYEVAKEVLNAGAHVINDIWGLKRSEKIANVVAKNNAGIILMHNQKHNQYNDMLNDIINDLNACIDKAIESGISKKNIMIDPGIGAPYGKDVNQQYEILSRLDKLKVLDVPILHAVSRKSLLGVITSREVDERLYATLSAIALGIQKKADFIRVHDVKEAKDVALIADRICRG